MDCTGILLAMKLCTAEPEPPPLPYTAEQGECLNKQQARAKYGSSHLYWHTARRCWDDQPTRRYTAPRALAERQRSKAPTVRIAANALADANGTPAMKRVETYEQRKAKQEIYYPALLQQQAAITADIYAVQKPITEWPLMLDVDAAGPNPDSDLDRCCWPNLQILLLEQQK
jgi:hypothetical protein